MKVNTLISAVTLLTSAGAVFAGNVDPFVDHTGFVSSRTRAEVIAEMQQAAARGSVARNSEYVDHSNVVSTKTRDEVRNEAVQAAKSRLFNSYIGGR
jgi:deoxyribose-phosphate aldolase